MDFREREAVNLKVTCPACGKAAPACVCRNFATQQPSRDLVPVSSRTGVGLGTIIGARYELVEKLGEGGMGTVYKARHISLNKPFAVKVLNADLTQNPEFMLRFDKEAKTAGLLNHQNMVAVFDYGLADSGEAFIVMEFVDGTSLGARLLQQKRLPVQQAARIFIQICDGLSSAHGMGIVHRDLKPANIMLTHTEHGEQSKIVDFGIAKAPGKLGEPALTKPGDIFGSPLYMSPEQCTGGVPDHRSDIYSLGCLMYECLTGMPPFLGESSFATLLMHSEAKAKPFDRQLAIPRELEQIVFKALAKSPQDRYQNMQQLRADLQKFAPPADGAKSQRRGKLPLAALVSILIGGSAAAVFFLYQNLHSKPPDSANQITRASTGESQPVATTPHDPDLALLALPPSAAKMTPDELLKVADGWYQQAHDAKDSDPAKAKHAFGFFTAYINEVIKRQPENFEAVEKRMGAEWDFGQIERALADSKRMIELHPKDALNYNTLGNVYSKLGREKEAFDTVNKGLLIDPKSVELLEQRASIFDGRGQYAEAIGDLKKVAASTRENSMQVLAKAYKNNKEPQEALKVINAFFKTKPDGVKADQLAYAYIIRADSEKSLGQYDRAIEDNREAIKIDPKTLAQRQKDIAELEELKARNRRGSSLSTAPSAQIQNPSDSDKAAYKQLVEKGRALLDSSSPVDGRPQPAKAVADSAQGFEYLAQAIEKQPDEADAYATREVYDWRFKLFDQGVRDCRRLAQMHPDDAGIRSELATFEWSSHHRQAAIQAVTEAHNISPKPVFLEQRSFYYYEEHRYLEVIQDLKDIASPTRQRTMQMLADSYLKTGEPATALAVLEKFFRTKPANLGKSEVGFAHFIKSNAERALRKYDAAAKDLKLAIENEPAYGYLKNELAELESSIAERRAHSQ